MMRDQEAIFSNYLEITLHFHITKRYHIFDNKTILLFRHSTENGKR